MVSWRSLGVSRAHAASFAAIIAILLTTSWFGEACSHHREGGMVYRPLKVEEILAKPNVDVNTRKQNYQSLEYIHNNMAKHVVTEKEVKVRPIAEDSDADAGWMKAALSAAIDCYGPCPSVPYGSVLIHKATGKMLMHGCNTAYLDATNHAEMNTIQWAAHFYPNQPRTWWNELTLYTTAEPCAMCMAAIRWTGIGEVVYATSIATQSSYGWGSIQVSAQTINNASSALQTRTTLEGPFGTTITEPYFAWQFNASAPCPPGCVRQASPAACIPQ